MFDRHHNKGSHMYIKIRNYSLSLIILGICLLLLGGGEDFTPSTFLGMPVVCGVS